MKIKNMAFYKIDNNTELNNKLIKLWNYIKKVN